MPDQNVRRAPMPRPRRQTSRSIFGDSQPISGLLFDANGVLYHRPHRNRRLNRFLSPYHLGVLSLDETEQRLAAAKGLAQVGRISTDDYYRAKLLAFGLTDPDLLDEGVQIMKEDSADIDLFPGAVESLGGLNAAGVRLGIVTDSAKPGHVKLGWLAARGLERDLFGTVVSSAEAGVCKPEPGIYLLALERLGLTPDRAAFVGHATDELLGAAEVGMMTIAFRPDDPDVEADVHIYELLDLAEAVGM